MSDAKRGQVSNSATQIYDEFFVPALFQEWTEPVLDAVQVTEGQLILDVACGTGVLARSAAVRSGDARTVSGIDINGGMLDVARQSNPDINWLESPAENLPFDDNYFDAVVSQFALMFFRDRSKAIQEMLRVLKPSHHLAIAVWGELKDTPGYAKMVELLLRLFGEEAANGIRAPYNLGDKKVLTSVLNDAGVIDYRINTMTGTAQFPSIEDWMFTDIKGWVLADSIDDDGYQQLLSEAQKEMQAFVLENGRVAFNAPAHIISITK